MALLKTLVDQDTKTRFADLAKSRALSESELLRLLVLEEIGGKSCDEGAPIPHAERMALKPVTVRLPEFLMDAANKRATSKGMAPSRWIASLVQSHLMREPVMTSAELAVLQESNRELAAIGRNINHMARRGLNESAPSKKTAALETLAAVVERIKENRAAIRAFVRGSQRAWGED